MPTSELRRWHGWSTGELEAPAPIVVRCSRCGFEVEGSLEQARAEYGAHRCGSGEDFTTESAPKEQRRRP